MLCPDTLSAIPNKVLAAEHSQNVKPIFDNAFLKKNKRHEVCHQIIPMKL